MPSRSRWNEQISPGCSFENMARPLRPIPGNDIMTYQKRRRGSIRRAERDHRGLLSVRIDNSRRLIYHYVNMLLLLMFVKA